MAAVKLFLGHGFADDRKKHVVSKYRGVVARERKNLGAWNEKLKRIYAESEHTADEDPLERFAKKKKKKQKNGENVSHVHEPCQKEIATTSVPNGSEVVSQSSPANTSAEKSSATSGNSR